MCLTSQICLVWRRDKTSGAQWGGIMVTESSRVKKMGDKQFKGAFAAEKNSRWENG